MKANEITIGDWVVVNDTDYPVPKQVDGIYKKGGAYYAVLSEYLSADVDMIEPIRLTREILKKNGFYYGYTSNEEDILNNTIATSSEDNKGWVWDEGAGSVKVIFPNESDGGAIIVDDQSFNKGLYFVFCEDIFVHELQHALRLCNIDKTIEL